MASAPGAMLTLLAGVGFLVLAATSIRYNRPNPLFLTLVLGTALGAVAGSVLTWPEDWERWARRLVPWLAWLAVGVSLLLYAYRSAIEIGWQELPRWPLWAQLGVVGLVLGSYATGRGIGPRWRFPIVAGTMLAIGGWVVSRWCHPIVDVYWLQQDACAQLAAGIDPYAAEHPDLPWNQDFDGLPVRAGDHLRSFPYPPLSLLLVLPGWWLGDVRYVLLGALVGTAWLAVAAGRRSGLPAGHPTELLAVALLFYPMTLRILYNAWTEPMQALAAVGGVWGVLAARVRLAGLALAAVAGLKQFGFVGLPPLLAAGPLTARDLLRGVLVVGLATLPFALWDFPSFWLGIVTYHTSSAIRYDSFSLLAALDTVGFRLPTAVGFVLALGVTGLAAWRARGSAARAVLGAAAAYWTCFLFGKAAHANYLWFVAVLLTLAMLTAEGAWARQEQARIASTQASG